MICTILTHAGDIRQAQSLIQWIARLGKVNAPLLLVADRDTPFDQVLVCQKLAESAFTDFHVASNQVATKGWPDGPYSLFKAACETVHKRFKTPWLLLESDAIPLRPGWLDQISEAYQHFGQPFMGCVYRGTENFVDEKFMSGIAVYHPDTFTRLAWSPTPVHWDVHHRKEFTEHAADSKLISHFFGQLDGGVRFIADSREPQSPREKHLSWIPEGTALFHRDKEMSLIPLLTRKLFPNERLKNKIKPVFPIHGGDVAHAIHHARWMKQLTAGRKWDYTAVLSFDRSTPITEVNLLRNLLHDCFMEVEEFNYVRPPIPTYPATANWSWQNLALHMSRQKHPWFWIEADGIILKYDWLDQLQNEYELCGQDFMGAVVPHMLHTQGTAIYPHDAPSKMPGAMRSVQQAFDMDGQIGHLTHHSKLFCHVWSLVNRMPHPVGGGDLPINITADELRRWLPRESVFLHRIKDVSVLNALMSGQYVH